MSKTKDENSKRTVVPLAEFRKRLRRKKNIVRCDRPMFRVNPADGSPERIEGPLVVGDILGITIDASRERNLARLGELTQLRGIDIVDFYSSCRGG